MDIVGIIHDRLGNNPEDYRVVAFSELETGDIFGVWMSRYIYLGSQGAQQTIYDLETKEHGKSWLKDEEVVSFRRDLLIELWSDEYKWVRLVRAMRNFVNVHYKSIHKRLWEPGVGLMNSNETVRRFLSKL
jgi:hypothetical protein